MKINIHAGHNPDGKVACGAVGLIKESTEARKVKSKLITYLRASGHTVYDCTVDNGTSQSDVLQKIVKKCNEHIVDLDISIHFNAFNGKAKGSEVEVYAKGSKTVKQAEVVLDSLHKLGYSNRGVKGRSDLYYLRNTKNPAMLIEVCFCDNAEDCARYDADKVAKAIYAAITGKPVDQSTHSITINKLTKSKANELATIIKELGYKNITIN